jgi:pimeloyl-ACP methyl ester carboxylesterase
MSTPETPQIAELQAALDRGDLDSVRRTLLAVRGRDADVLEQELGSDAFDRARRAAARGGRRGKLGKVLVLPGIMGTELDSVDRTGDVDRIWIHFVRLLAGRIRELELTPAGDPAPPGIHIRPAGLHRKTYVPILLELDTRWHVRPFPFDWREDIDRSAARLDAEVQAFGAGEPVHLVAHSMGGLVSRRFAQLHPDTWRAMDDTTGAGRGGRLVMLGTPNRGSFAIPLTLTGSEKLLKLLAKGDIDHSLRQLLQIVGTFPGLYQMLPSPLVDLGDDHGQLFDATSWGRYPVKPPLLAKADTFIRALDTVIDPQRLLYVAGVNRETPARITIEPEGKFTYRQTLDGDGRVPHELGLLEGVTTYWVDETHGDLAKNGQVLDAITELLRTGRTTVLPTTKPPKPRTRAAAAPAWQTGDSVDPLPTEARAIAEKAKATRRSTGEPHLTPEEEATLENLTLDAYLGTGGGTRALPDGGDEDALAETTADEPAAGPGLSIEIEVVWGDVTKVAAQVYAVGHYQGVTPQRAELALDEAVSGVRGQKEYERRRLVITQHAARGSLHADLGDVSFFPWGDARHANRAVAVAGMGRPGTFDGAGLRRLVSELVVAVSALPPAQTICAVLIGSGEGTLTIPQAVQGWMDGICDAAEEIATAGIYDAPVKKLVFAEVDRGRAEELLGALERELARRIGPMAPRAAELRLDRRLRRGSGGTVSCEEAIALLGDTLVEAAGAASRSSEGRALATLFERTDANQTVRRLALERLRGEGATEREDTTRPRFRVERRVTGPPSEVRIPARISFWDDGQTIRAAAIHQAATVPERFVGVGRDVVDDLVAKMIDPSADDAKTFGRLLQRLLVPLEFQDVLGSGSFVFELDRTLARLHWEMQPDDMRDDDEDVVPLSVRRPLARQLRTAYSPAPTRPVRPDGRLKALVIGDPGDPEKQEDLPGARSEALKVKELLEASGEIDVEARIGAPNVPREDALFEVKPADRLEVLSLLLDGDFDLVHYAGHGDFDPDQPSRVGWVFAAGLLTPGEIGRLERVPAVIVSNACLSARTSHVLGGARRPDEARTEAGLLPSLADEFFKLGVRNYVGTAWEVNDIGAELFAQDFYTALLSGESFGEAIRIARESLWRDRETYGALWAAYQHYGYPAATLGHTAADRFDD